MGIFVTLDGVDGTGKSTIGRLLAIDGKYQYYKTPSGPFSQLRGQVDKHATPLERYCFYRLATQYDSKQVRGMVQNASIICDRYIASTLAYHLTMDPRIADIHNNSDLVIPDFAFLLLAESKERNRRLDIRATMASDAALEQNRELLNRVQRTFIGLNDLGYLPFKLIPIETTDKTPKEVTANIEGIINQRKY